MEETHDQSGHARNACGIVGRQSFDIPSKSNSYLSIKSRGTSALASWMLTLILSCSPAICPAQSTPAAVVPSPSPKSLGEELRHPDGKEIHIFYIHGIGSDGPHDRDSRTLRKSICDYLKDCTTPEGTPIGEWDYADQDAFQLGASVPALEYMDQQIWKSQEEWQAAAPYAVHFQLARSNGPALYVDELNWWPLTFSLKCRQIIAADASLVAPSKARIETCSTREPNTGVSQRFRSYDWISKDEATRLRQLPARGARANRQLKSDLMDWAFSDAVMALGPLRTYILNGIRQLILKSLADAPGASQANNGQPRANQEFIVVSHSLGSYLIFTALDMDQSTGKPAAAEQSLNDLREILKRTSLVVFFANQLRLLELVGLDGPSERNIATRLGDWGKARCEYLKSLPNASQECKPPRIVALNDPSDLLTWTVPALSDIHVENYSVRNSTHWLWLFENPTSAHSNYATDKRAIKEMLTSTSEEKK
ncbi:MAG TPA: hypothetical protein VNY78_05480 [Edaphobacter sp.]|nr:hypothetical protein [Edaphobacter sp.]